jgi:hypothetical protein
MAQTDYASNLYGPKTFGDLSCVLIKIRDTAVVASESSPDVTVTAAGSGVYNLTFPKATVGWFVSAQIIGLGSAVQAEVVSFSATLGTASIDTGSDLAGNDECHILIVLGAN